MFANGLTKSLLITKLRKYKELWGLMDRNKLLRKKISSKKEKNLLNLYSD